MGKRKGEQDAYNERMAKLRNKFNYRIVNKNPKQVHVLPTGCPGRVVHRYVI